ncbi:hypothetical protein CRUP_021095, partial [Coryphaenoides rupestris]
MVTRTSTTVRGSADDIRTSRAHARFTSRKSRLMERKNRRVPLTQTWPPVPDTGPQGGEFTRQTEVTFQPGNEKLSFTQEFKGIDEHDHLVVSTTLEGRVPEVPRGATVQLEKYSEIYQYSNN